MRRVAPLGKRAVKVNPLERCGIMGNTQTGYMGDTSTGRFRILVEKRKNALRTPARRDAMR